MKRKLTIEQKLRKIVREIMREKVISEMNEAENPCWKGYEQIGMKMKDGKKVPNCVPKNESVNEASLELKKLEDAIKMFQDKIEKQGRVTNARDEEHLQNLIKVYKQMGGKNIKESVVNEAASRTAKKRKPMTENKLRKVIRRIVKEELIREEARRPDDSEFQIALKFAKEQGSDLASIGVDSKTGDINIELDDNDRYVLDKNGNVKSKFIMMWNIK